MFLVLLAGFIGAGAFYGQARDGGDTPFDALRQYRHMQETQRTRRPAPIRRTKVRASPFSLPMQRLKAPPAPPPSIFVHVLGDSLADQTGAALSRLLADRPDIAVKDDTNDESGLARPDAYDWNQAVARLLAGGDRIDAVVILLGSNDEVPIEDGGAALEPHTEGWRKAYARRIDAMLAPLKARNIRIFWLGLPPMRDEALSAGMAELNGLYRDRVTAAGGLYTDIWDGFVNADGSYAASGTGLDGQPARLRLPDGVHFSDEGARIAAHFVEGDLRRALGEGAPAPVVATAPLGEPDDTLKPGVVEKPEYGPVLPLRDYDPTPGGTLLGTNAAPPPSAADPSVAAALARGEPLPPKEGRADDFRWPEGAQ
ncbi:SGNH/GDSL hydrolase family protein [Labrys monachus]|uniref:SGNH hydrolase-type esterase domain-containing protein n=1 Tax=Labrys monachus TaxID=217067 RepID=A0ABU0FNK2_9HYPH|nr:SGNH family hydrolase [Labrys monachus]MDQ0396192.1 hypothetical protein [Labrys monachus]